MATCSSCGAEILWVTMFPSGKAMPLDHKAEKRIRVLSVEGEALEGRMVDAHTSHFATCPDAAAHRRRT